MSRVDHHLQAFGVPFAGSALLDDNDGSATGSSYTEASPRPGTSEPRDPLSLLVPVISGAQSADLELVTVQTGSPGTELLGSCEVGYRFAGETDEQLRGWCAPNWLTAWRAAIWTAATTYDRNLLCTHGPTQKVVVSYNRANFERWIRVWDPRTATWDDPVAVTTVAAIGSDDDFIVCLPTGRLLCKYGTDVFRSDDVGTTWVLHAERIDASGLVAGSRVRAAAGATGILLCNSNAFGTLEQFASDDLLGSVHLVESNATFGDLVQVVALPQGGFVAAYRRNSDSALVCRTLPSPWAPLSGAPAKVIDSSNCPEFALAVDPDGVLWAHWTRNASRSEVRVATSADGGATWTDLGDTALRLSSAHNDYLTNFDATSACGQVFLLHNKVATVASSTDGSVGMAVFGGWSSVTPADVPWSDRLGSGSTTSGLSWVPIELPSDTGQWTLTGAGAAALVSPGELQLGDGTSVQVYYQATLGTDLYQVVSWSMRMGAGGALATDDCVVNVRLANGTSDYEVTVRMGPTGVRVRDENAATTLVTLLETFAEERQFTLRLREPGGTTYSYGSLWWRLPSETAWTLIWEGGLTVDTATPAAAGRVRWGHLVASTTISYWTHLFHVGDATRPALVGCGLDQPQGMSVRGRPIGALPVPLHPETGPEAALLEVGGGPARLAVVAGPGALSEVYDVPAAHDYPVEALFGAESPSPSARWRSDDTSEQVFAFDWQRLTWQGDGFLLLARDCNFRVAYLEAYQSGAWSTVGTLDLATGGTGLSYLLDGTCLVPSAGTASAGRFYGEGELAGATVVLDGVQARRIAWNTPGVWGPSSGGSARVRITLDADTLDGTEPTSGACVLVHHSGVLAVVNVSAIAVARRWRVRIPAAQVVVDAFYEAGMLEPMTLRGVTGCDWGWSRERGPNVSTRRSRAGTTRVRREGPPARSLTIGWAQSATDQLGIRQGAPNYLSAASGSLPLATAEDVPLFLEGLVDLVDGGRIPTVFLPAVPAADTTLTDPTLWLHGRLEGVVRSDHVVGTEGAGEVVRPASMTIREVV